MRVRIRKNKNEDQEYDKGWGKEFIRIRMSVMNIIKKEGMNTLFVSLFTGMLILESGM